MKGYRKVLWATTTLLLGMMLFLVGCGQKNESVPQGGADKVLVYTSLFPVYSFTKSIGGDHVEVKSIVPPGAEPHDFEPSPKDLGELNEAKLFVYNGAGYEAWIEKVGQNLDKSKTKVLDASQGVQLIESTAGEHDHEGTAVTSGHTEEEHGHEHGKYDPHVWLDPMRAKQQAQNIEKALIEIDPAHKADYEKNYQTLAADLDAVDQEYKGLIAKAGKKELVVSHKAFTYLANRYGLDQISVSGLSPSEEPTQQQLKQLIDTVKQHNIKYVAFEGLVENKVAKTVQRESGAEAVTLYTLENVTKAQLDAGKTYGDLMRDNLQTLKKVLEVK
ncbi:zinc transport system substrate-binding protein [Aneurinibacillus soli]|uniref:High-affinity zinc uptake system binding-protein ZnuA n=1 Tax=Aneurinibacillus soli TaxID=1500254 RepID=A0A0U5AQ78_9BACL|nr:metal ABC transporter substrate-binding protein [Aneurinibacillus soli]PYE57166.1 zinc transport system substrate-binding protein [Aneurinibacillus soli]BAU25978.1 High-affinity zinc uptake system binding-protein ZnuA precursor [Aneurinibacillus soli]